MRLLKQFNLCVCQPTRCRRASCCVPACSAPTDCRRGLLPSLCFMQSSRTRHRKNSCSAFSWRRASVIRRSHCSSSVLTFLHRSHFTCCVVTNSAASHMQISYLPQCLWTQINRFWTFHSLYFSVRWQNPATFLVHNSAAIKVPDPWNYCTVLISLPDTRFEYLAPKLWPCPNFFASNLIKPAVGPTKVIVHPVIKSGALQRLINVHVANDRQCTTSSAAVHWPNWTVACSGFTRQIATQY